MGERAVRERTRTSHPGVVLYTRIRNSTRRLVSDSVTFAYRAAEPSGRIVRGQLMAASREAATRSLADRGLWALELNPRSPGSPFARSRRLSPAHLALGLR